MLKKFDQFIFEKRGGKYTIFCDLDGVLVDFNRGFMEIPENPEKLSPHAYEKLHGKNSIWPILDKLGEDFWSDLPWTQDGRELWDYLKQYDPIILSAPSRSPECLAGKTKWIKLHLHIDEEPVTKPEDFTSKTRIILDQDKWKYARNEFDILIDDFDTKLNKWTDAGGTGILHNDSTDSIRVLEGIMEIED